MKSKNKINILEQSSQLVVTIGLVILCLIFLLLFIWTGYLAVFYTKNGKFPKLTDLRFNAKQVTQGKDMLLQIFSFITTYL
jgi:hypothetical protein